MEWNIRMGKLLKCRRRDVEKYSARKLIDNVKAMRERFISNRNLNLVNKIHISRFIILSQFVARSNLFHLEINKWAYHGLDSRLKKVHRQSARQCERLAHSLPTYFKIGEWNEIVTARSVPEPIHRWFGSIPSIFMSNDIDNYRQIELFAVNWGMRRFESAEIQLIVAATWRIPDRLLHQDQEPNLPNAKVETFALPEQSIRCHSWLPKIANIHLLKPFEKSIDF